MKLASDRGRPTPERLRTDERLRTEREKTDRALTDTISAIESEADGVVQQARDQADMAVEVARDIADQRSDSEGVQADFARAALENERKIEDDVLRRERAVADESVVRERRESARVLAALLPLEREQTDRSLVTERARSDDVLAHRDDFLGMVSHDLRSLLGGIVMSAGLLDKHSREDAPTRSAKAQIERYVARMNRLIGDLVDVVSIDAGKLKVAPVDADVGAVVADAVEAFTASASSKGIRLVMDVKRPAIGRVDHDRLLQVMANLITNAIKFTPSGGAITVSCARSGAEVRISVADTGSGIPSEKLEAVFERFWQGAQNDPRGVGLGLYISRRIVEAHGGRIWAESSGAGATFFVTLPA